MTPFDPIALVAMLVAFYPIVSPASFQRARGERPEYFAGGQVIGSKGDKLQLPDGRVFDCIYAAGGPASGRRWICIDVTHDPPGEPDPFPLEDGPLIPADEDFVLPPIEPAGFESLVSAHLAGLEGADAVLVGAGQTVTEFDGARALEDSYAHTVEPALVAHTALRDALEGDDPADIMDAANEHGTIIDVTAPDYVEPEPPDTTEPDPGQPPGGTEPEPGPPPI